MMWMIISDNWVQRAFVMYKIVQFLQKVHNLCVLSSHIYCTLFLLGFSSWFKGCCHENLKGDLKNWLACVYCCGHMWITVHFLPITRIQTFTHEIPAILKSFINFYD